MPISRKYSCGIDPRVTLGNKLLEIGLPNEEAWLIAIDAGGQGIIDREYLVSCGIKRRKLQDKILWAITKFAIGDFD